MEREANKGAHLLRCQSERFRSASFLCDSRHRLALIVRTNGGAALTCSQTAAASSVQTPSKLSSEHVHEASQGVFSPLADPNMRRQS